MSLRECECPRPVAKVKPGRERFCERCGFYLGDSWRSSDANLDRFFNSLTSCQNVPITVADFEGLCDRREREGRDKFKFAYLDRDNISEAAEEAADLALYMYLDLLKAEREGNGDEGRDLAMTVAFHAAQAYDALARLRQKRNHSP